MLLQKQEPVMPSKPDAAPGPIRVWDPDVLIFQWLLVASIPLVFLSPYEEGAFSVWHIPTGWAAALLIALRLVRGFVGGEHARFIRFIRPAQIVPHCSRSNHFWLWRCQ